MEHLKQKLAIDTIVPLRINMDLHADAIGLPRLPGFSWEPYVPQTAPPPAVTASPCPAAVEKREAKRQRTLAKRKAEAAAETPAVPMPPPPTLLGIGRGLLSWSQCAVPLTAVVNRERDEHVQTKDLVVVSTSD